MLLEAKLPNKFRYFNRLYIRTMFKTMVLQFTVWPSRFVGRTEQYSISNLRYNVTNTYCTALGTTVLSAKGINLDKGGKILPFSKKAGNLRRKNRLENLKIGKNQLFLFENVRLPRREADD